MKFELSFFVQRRQEKSSWCVCAILHMIYYLGTELFLFVSHRVMKDKGSTCKFCNARSTFRNLHVDPLSFITQWETKKYKCNSILIFILRQNCPVLAMKYPFLIHNRAVFKTAAKVAGSYITVTVSQKNRCQNFSYVHSSRKHWKYKYILI